MLAGAGLSSPLTVLINHDHDHDHAQSGQDVPPTLSVSHQSVTRQPAAKRVTGEMGNLENAGGDDSVGLFLGVPDERLRTGLRQPRGAIVFVPFQFLATPVKREKA